MFLVFALALKCAMGKYTTYPNPDQHHIQDQHHLTDSVQLVSWMYLPNNRRDMLLCVKSLSISMPSKRHHMPSYVLNEVKIKLE